MRGTLTSLPSRSNQELGRNAAETDLLGKITENPIHKFLSQLLGYNPQTAAEAADITLRSAKEAPSGIARGMGKAMAEGLQYGPAGTVPGGLQALGAATAPIAEAARTGQKAISEKVGGVPGAALAMLPDLLLALLGGRGTPKGTPGAQFVENVPRRVSPGLREGASPILPTPLEQPSNYLQGTADRAMATMKAAPNPQGIDPRLIPQGGTGTGRIPGTPRNPEYLSNVHAREGIPPDFLDPRRMGWNPAEHAYPARTYPPGAISTGRDIDFPGMTTPPELYPWATNTGGTPKTVDWSQLGPLFEQLYK